MAKKTFEENMKRLEQIVAQLEKGEAQLAESLLLFEEGSQLIGECNTMLEKAEQQVVKLSVGTNGEPMEEPFAQEGAEDEA